MNNNIRKSRDAFASQVKSSPVFEEVHMRRCSFLVRTNTWDGDVNTGIRIYNSNVYRLNLLFEGDECEISEGRDFREEDKAKRYGTFVFNERARTEYGLEIGSLIDSMEIVGLCRMLNSPLSVRR